MTSEFPAHFACNYQCLLNRLKLHGMQPKTIALYSHGVRRAGDYFDYRIDDLTRLQLTDYLHISSIRFPGVRSNMTCTG